MHRQEESGNLAGQRRPGKGGNGVVFIFLFPIPFPYQGRADWKPSRSQAAEGGRTAGSAASLGNFPASPVGCATPG